MKRVGFIVLVMVIQLAAFGQPKNPGSKASGASNNKNVDQVPITGVEILIGLGGLFGARRFFKKEKNKN